MPERNFCREAGCMFSCCRDVYFISSYFVREILKSFPEAKKVWNLAKPTEDGVYYDGFLGIAGVRIVGQCPNLNSDESCSIYDRRPKDCRDLGVGSDNCVLLRRV